MKVVLTFLAPGEIRMKVYESCMVDKSLYESCFDSNKDES